MAYITKETPGYREDTPRPLSRCGAMVAPDQDARWRGFGLAGTKLTSGDWGRFGGRIDTLRRLELQHRLGEGRSRVVTGRGEVPTR